MGKTNRYATMPNAEGRTRGHENWEEFTLGGLKAFMAKTLYMGMKKQPNHKLYWMRDLFLHCPKISSIFSRAGFIDLRRCLHVTNSRAHGNVEGALQDMTSCIKHDGL